MRLHALARDWVDKTLRGRTNPKVLILPAMMAGAVAAVSAREFGAFGYLVGVVFGLFALAWIVFTIWRWWVYLKEIGRTAGEVYEEIGRYQLPPEYTNSEDALLAAERRRNSTPPLR